MKFQIKDFGIQKENLEAFKRKLKPCKTNNKDFSAETCFSLGKNHTPEIQMHQVENTDPNVNQKAQMINQEHKEFPTGIKMSNEMPVKSNMTSDNQICLQNSVKSKDINKEKKENDLQEKCPQNISSEIYNEVKRKISKGWIPLMKEYKKMLIIWSPNDTVGKDLLDMALKQNDKSVTISEWFLPNPSCPELLCRGTLAKFRSEEYAKRSANGLIKRFRHIKALTFQDFTHCLIDAEIKHALTIHPNPDVCLTRIAITITKDQLDAADCIHQRFDTIRNFKFIKSNSFETEDAAVVEYDFGFTTQAIVAAMILSGIPSEKTNSAPEMHIKTRIEVSEKVKSILNIFNEVVESNSKRLYSA